MKPENRPINPGETLIAGNWLVVSETTARRADPSEARIEELVSNHLVKIADKEGWDILYRDPSDNRLWELTRRHGELQGGGPKMLQCLNVHEAFLKYGEAATWHLPFNGKKRPLGTPPPGVKWHGTPPSTTQGIRP